MAQEPHDSGPRQRLYGPATNHLSRLPPPYIPTTEQYHNSQFALQLNKFEQPSPAKASIDYNCANKGKLKAADVSQLFDNYRVISSLYLQQHLRVVLL